MATMTIRIPDSKHNRLRRLAESHGVSLNKLVDEWASMALAQFDAETRFQARAARGDARRGLAARGKNPARCRAADLARDRGGETTSIE
jgi:predicted transcriptional regulator